MPDLDPSEGFKPRTYTGMLLHAIASDAAWLVGVRSPKGSVVVFAIIGFIVSLMCAFALVGAIAFLARFTPNEPEWRYARPLSLAIVAFLGLLFFYVRKRARLVYGIAEITFALTIAWVRAPDFQWETVRTMEGRSVALALTAAGVYVMVRGLDSCAIGLQAYRNGYDINDADD